MKIIIRGLAQMARVPGLGPGGREFESRIPEIKKLKVATQGAIFFICVKVYYNDDRNS